VLKIMFNIYNLGTKEIRAHSSQEYAILARLQREKAHCAHVVELLHHVKAAMPPLSELPDWDCTEAFDETEFVALPFLPLNLQQVLMQRKSARGVGPFFDHEEVSQIGEGLLKAVRFLQKHGVVHRDLKPDNVMLTQRDGCWVPVLIDFGIALEFPRTRGFITNFIVGFCLGGNPSFLPPEIRWAQPSMLLDYSKSDQFGVGLTIWSMLATDTSVLPYQERQNHYIALAPGCCNERAEALIVALTQPDPKERLRLTEKLPAWNEARPLSFEK
jgi:serine/threonine protein kinase